MAQGLDGGNPSLSGLGGCAPISLLVLPPEQWPFAGILDSSTRGSGSCLGLLNSRIRTWGGLLNSRITLAAHERAHQDFSSLGSPGGLVPPSCGAQPHLERAAALSNEGEPLLLFRCLFFRPVLRFLRTENGSSLPVWELNQKKTRFLCS